jgi:hypothetical protein
MFDGAPIANEMNLHLSQATHGFGGPGCRKIRICHVTNIVMEHRRNEPARTWFRSHRIFRSDSNWYFHTREGIDVGPFASEFEAQVEASILKSLLKEAPSGKAALATVREFLLDAGTSSCDLKSFTDYVEKEGRF